jgi:hypothetical protein
MTSILEGIYLTHKVNFRFINVLQNILEEENIVKDAYVEEIKLAFNRFVKSVDSAIAVVPEIRKFLEDTKRMRENPPKSKNTLLAGSIMSGAIFVGSTILYATNHLVGEMGMIGSVVMMGITVAIKEH